jgi:nitroimidazol reductase NimA-like FMN-containing flavoprotein (pyridoxamine 5'-phosphate oxidase superfamily)
MTMSSDRPSMPQGYGIAAGEDGTLPWVWVEQQCAKAHNYWICTVRTDGRPHAIPVWGLWFDDAIVFSTDPASTKARNFTARPDVVVHLESGDEVVVVEGRVEAFDRSRMVEFCDRYEEKYSHRPSEAETAGVYVVRPQRVLAWQERDFPTSATRFNRVVPSTDDDG